MLQGRPILLAALLLTTRLLAQQQAGWVDPSPHTQRLVPVDPDTSIEVLDWGGSGRPIVLLAQLGQTAHIYDDWAPRLARTYHVLALTRRGYGQSSAPSTGYSMDRLGADIVAVLDAEKLSKPVVVASGFAGEELTRLGTQFQMRAAGLIFLDAAYDRSKAAAEVAIMRRIPPQPPRPEDLESVQSVKRWQAASLGFPIPEAEIRQFIEFGADGRLVSGPRASPAQRQIISGIAKPDYPEIRVPVLGIYKKPKSPEYFPGCRTSDVTVRQACRELYVWTLQQLKDSERLLRTTGSRVRVIEIPDASQFVFLSNEREVMRAVDSFMSALPN